MVTLKFAVFQRFEAVNPSIWITTSGRKFPPFFLVCCEKKTARLFATLAPRYHKILKFIVCIHSEPSVHSGYTFGQGKDLCAFRNRNPVICHASDWSKYKFSHFELKVQYHSCKNSSGVSLCIFLLSSNGGFHQSFEMMPHSKWKKRRRFPPSRIWSLEGFLNTFWFDFLQADFPLIEFLGRVEKKLK